MSSSGALRDKRMLQETMLAKVEDALMQGSSRDSPAYTLILGAGASAGIVPTAKEMLGLPDPRTKQVHAKCIPVWLAEERGAKVPADARAKCCTEFWGKFRAQNAGGDKCKVIEFSEDDLPRPTSIASAYQAVFETACVGGLDTPERHVQYLREVTMAGGSVTRLNAAQFFLASLLSLQGRGEDLGARKERFYRGRRPFARTIFTTNFDPILQTSLQLFQLLYYMTDRPEFLPADALYTDSNPSIHLFYAHGSVHRPFLANTDGQITLLKQKNAKALAGYLSNHGVIVLGYSGWDDCLLQALNETRTFSNNLYWLARGEGSISGPVAEFLQGHPNAYWVPIEDGGCLMAALHRRLCPGAPNTELLYNPIRPLLSQVGSVSLQGIATSGADRDRDHTDRGGGGEISEAGLATPTLGALDDVETIRRKVIEILKDAERRFVSMSDAGGGWQEIERQADLSYANNDWDSALQWYQRLLDLTPDLPVENQALAMFHRAVCWGEKGNIGNAIADYLAVIDINPVSASLVASTRVNLGVSWAERGEIDKAISDLSTVVDMTDAPVDLVAHARVDRGLLWGSRGDVDRAIAEYTAVIDMTGAPEDLAAKARFNRSVRWSQKGDTDKAMADLTAVIDMTGAPVDLVASARFNRGVHWGRQGDVDKAIAEYTVVIEASGAPADLVARARANRGSCWGQRGELDKAIAEYTAAIEMTGAPTDLVALARVDRGTSWAEKGEVDRAMSDYTAVIEMTGAPADIVAKARINRSVSWRRKGEVDKEMADYTAIIEMAGAPADLVARAQFDRGVSWRRQGDVDKEMADYAAIIEMAGAPVDFVAKARLNRGLCLGEKGDTDKAMADFNAVIDMPNVPAEAIAAARYNRAVGWGRKGDIEKAMADYVAVVDLPGAPADLAAKAREVLRLTPSKKGLS